jgi:hypothetical protein
MKEMTRNLAERCFVLVDDANEAESWKATLDFLPKREGKFKLLFDQRTSSGGHTRFWNGLTLFART